MKNKGFYFLYFEFRFLHCYAQTEPSQARYGSLSRTSFMNLCFKKGIENYDKAIVAWKVDKLNWNDATVYFELAKLFSL
jgi:hypothetical protein